MAAVYADLVALGADRDVFAKVMQEHQACLDRGELSTAAAQEQG